MAHPYAPPLLLVESSVLEGGGRALYRNPAVYSVHTNKCVAAC